MRASFTIENINGVNYIPCYELKQNGLGDYDGKGNFILFDINAEYTDKESE